MLEILRDALDLDGERLRFAAASAATPSAATGRQQSDKKYQGRRRGRSERVAELIFCVARSARGNVKTSTMSIAAEIPAAR